MNKSKKKDLWIILDFHGAKRSMHQWVYVKKYRDYLQDSFQVDTICWLPSTTDPEIIKDLGAQKSEMILKSLEYTNNQNFIPFLLNYAIIKFLNWNFLENYTHVLNFFRNFLARCFLFKPHNRLMSLGKKYDMIHLVFPCSSPLSIRLIEMIPKSKRKNFEVFLVFSTGENKGLFRFHNFENKIEEIATTISLTLGTETVTYQKKIEESYTFKNRIKWSPTPFSSINTDFRATRDVVALGFLGSARPNKGFITIPGLLAELKNCNVAFTAIIQKSIYPWATYDQSIVDINNLQLPGINFLNADLSHEQFIAQFQQVDIIILPYSAEFYKFAGSAILFMAADYGIPIIAPKGLSFEWDLSKFGIGYTYDSEADFVRCVKNCRSQDFTRNFVLYNKQRSVANDEFFRK